MNVLTDNVFGVYRKFLVAAFGSALMTSIYSLVDAAVVGQYHGPLGVATMAIIAPIWNILFSLGLLAGIGGSVLYAVRRGAALWWAIPIAEAAVAVYAILSLRRPMDSASSSSAREDVL